MAKGIGDVIYNLLSNDTGVTDITSTRIYPFMAIEDIAYPYLVYTIESTDPTQTKCTTSALDVVSVNVEIYSETLSESEALKRNIRNLLDRYKGTVEGIEVQSISFRDEDGGYADEDRVYLDIQSYSCRLKTITASFGRVTDLVATGSSSSSIGLTWSDVATGETGYEVWRSTNFVSWVLISVEAADSISYSDAGLDADTSYVYKVRAINTTTEGEWSNVSIGSTTSIGGSCDDATVENSDVSYQVNVTSGDTLVLPDITHTQSDGTPTVTPAQTPFVCDTFTDVVITDALNPSSPITKGSGETYTCTASVSGSGIAYQRPLMNQTVSYRTGDEAWRVANDPLVINSTPADVARLDLTALDPWLTLGNLNIHGDNFRFTADDGTQTFVKNTTVIQDHLTGLEWKMKRYALDNWDGHIDNAIVEGFYLPTFKELLSIQNTLNVGLSYHPFTTLYVAALNQGSSTTCGTTTNAQYITHATAGIATGGRGKTLTTYALYCRPF